VRLFQWDRDFGVFFCTQGVSNIGDAAWGVLIPLYVLQLTHNPLQVSAIAIIEAVAFALLRMPFGALADRLECRRLMIIADLGRTLLTLVIPVAAAFNANTLIVIYIAIVPIEAFSALFDAASGSAVPMLVTEDKRGIAYAWQESFESIAWVIGPPLGGLLAVAFGTGQALGLDSVSFLVSVAGLIAIRKRFAPEPDAGHEPMLASIRSGLRLMIIDRVLRRDQLVWSLYSVLGSSIVLGLVYISTKGGRNDAALATIAVAAYAAGSAVGTLLAARFEGAPNLWLAEAAGLGVAAGGAALLAIGGVPPILAGGALFGLGEGLVLVFHLTLRARVTPEGYFGRITGVAGVVGQVTSGLSMVWLGLVLRFAPGRTAFIVLAAAAAALAAAVALARKPPLPRSAPRQDQDQHPAIERTPVPPDPPASP
jgi:Major Facilitator Superfamily